MKAIVYSNYGSPEVLRLEEIAKPVPKDNEVLIRVRASSVNPYDSHFMTGDPHFMRLMTGLRRPKYTQLGVDVAGVVEAIGANVTQLKPGDEVFGSSRGAYAEYATTAETTVAPKPPNIPFEQAGVMAVGAMTALQGLRDTGRVQAGHKVLINGAAGGVGTFAVQIAKSLGADVTGVCSTPNVPMVRSIGADRVIDYTQESFPESGQQYDCILDCIFNHPVPALRRVLKPHGVIVLVGMSGDRFLGPLSRVLGTMALSPFYNKKLKLALTKGRKEDLLTIGALLESGEVRPVIDRKYRLSELPKAMAYLQTGHVRGKVAITVGEEDHAAA